MLSVQPSFGHEDTPFLITVDLAICRTIEWQVTTLDKPRILTGGAGSEEAITIFLRSTRCAKHNTGIAGEGGNSAGCLDSRTITTHVPEPRPKFAELQKPSTLLMPRKESRTQVHCW